MKRDNTIIIGEFYWRMEIDIKALAYAAGRHYKDKYTGKNYTDYSLIKAKKLLKLIYQYAYTADDLNKVSQIIAESKNQKLIKYWREIINEDTEILLPAD